MGSESIMFIVELYVSSLAFGGSSTVYIQANGFNKQFQILWLKIVGVQFYERGLEMWTWSILSHFLISILPI